MTSEQPASHPTGATLELAVARVVRAHGVRGQLLVIPLTDEPLQRLAAGTVLRVERPVAGQPSTLTVSRLTVRADRVVLTVEEVPDRDVAEQLRRAVLLADVPVDRAPADPQEFYDHQLVGLAAQDGTGAVLGTVSAVDHHGAQDLLVVTTPDGRDVLVPFVAALVPEVDPPAGRIVVNPPGGLFDPPAAAPAGADDGDTDDEDRP